MPLAAPPRRGSGSVAVEVLEPHGLPHNEPIDEEGRDEEHSCRQRRRGRGELPGRWALAGGGSRGPGEAGRSPRRPRGGAARAGGGRGGEQGREPRGLAGRRPQGCAGAAGGRRGGGRTGERRGDGEAGGLGVVGVRHQGEVAIVSREDEGPGEEAGLREGGGAGVVRGRSPSPRVPGTRSAVGFIRGVSERSERQLSRTREFQDRADTVRRGPRRGADRPPPARDLCASRQDSDQRLLGHLLTMPYAPRASSRSKPLFFSSPPSNILDSACAWLSRFAATSASVSVSSARNAGTAGGSLTDLLSRRAIS